jgi:ribonuclease HII
VSGRAPDRSAERRLWAAGHEVIVGFDEVGRGSWAGPLAVGAAVINPRKRITGVRDSKQLSERERERRFDKVREWLLASAVGMVTAAECDALGMSAAQKLAARRALDELSVAGFVADAVLIDGPWDFVGADATTERLVKGDARCMSIAAASIIAKVTRDRLMRREAEHYDRWAFESNKGYPCPKHKVALHGDGPSAIHRRSWVFMDGLAWTGLRRPAPEQLGLF